MLVKTLYLREYFCCECSTYKNANSSIYQFTELILRDILNQLQDAVSEPSKCDEFKAY